MIQLRISGDTPLVIDAASVRAGKLIAAHSGWLMSAPVKSFDAFVSVNDYDTRIVHEWDAPAMRWYEVEMHEDAQP